MSTTTIYNYMKSVKCRRSSKRVARKNGEKEREVTESFPMGNLRFLPGEVRHKVFDFLLLSDLGNVALTSRTLRNTVMCYLHGKQALLVIIPEVVSNISSVQDSLDEQRDKCLKHFRDLGILMKRSTCLYPTKERLREVGMLLDKLRDTHTEICMCLGSDIAYSCYGEFLRAFVAGWEDEEKFRAYHAIKGASCLDERTKQVLNSAPGSQPWYERYIRVFCRQVFLDKSSDNTEKGFWLCKILQPWPLVFQARLLYILYGPLSENGWIDWDVMATCPSFYGVEDVTLRELAENLRVLYEFAEEWTNDDLISVFDEMIAFPTDWCHENVAKLLKLSGHSITVEVLGSKAVNGRIHELAYLGYYLVQALGQENISQGRGKQLVEFANLLQNILSNMANYKEKSVFITSFFNVWEENILSLGEEMQEDLGDTPEEQEQVFTGSIHCLTQLAGILLKNYVK